MFNWAKQQLANVAGTEEPIYGPSAIQTVSEQAKTTPYTELKREDLKWFQQGGTNVETQVFYFTADSGHIGMVQIIYSSLAGIRKTAQLTSKIIYPDQSKPILWSSDPLENWSFEDGVSLKAQGCSITLSPDGNSYTIKSTLNKNTVLDLKVHRTAPGFVVGKDGTTHFGTDPQNPWGSMRHAFWPRCKVEGNILTQAGPVDFSGKGIFIHALQGMKPHHAAARWNFVNFQAPTYTAVMMEYTTPPSYGSTTVNVGCIATDEKILFAGANNTATHTSTKTDPEIGWPEPTAFKFEWTSGTSKAVLEGPYGPRIDRVDVMAEVPGFVKTIVASAVGTKPYIYQFLPKPELVIDHEGQQHREHGTLFTEATFISGQ
ncbi:survival factor 1 [Myriangium duriaei CBS 260.36]|uniref:Survival factor 1 n=1 Tax=Myriangium duriaei CBS 260.36 TaxID=1168546 RepID=A0A9P4J0F9_9PEZI|nr:survival factor 1 [Myriangium duriaei CBS 260.36]